MIALVQWARAQVRYASSSIAKADTKGLALPPLKATRAKKEAQTMLKYIYDTQQRFPDAVVMTQVGAFMELYFDQAVDYGPKLNLKVARKSQSSPIPGQSFVNMAGFPIQHKEKYERLIVNEWGKSVVSLMQDSRHVLQGGSEAEKRPVTRILTPGTLLTESFVDLSLNNYLCCMHAFPTQNEDLKVCMMWVDVASGDVKYQIVEEADIGNTLTRICPSEVLLNRSNIARGRSKNSVLEETIATYAPQAVLSKHRFPPIEWWSLRANANERFEIEELGTVPARAFVGLISYIDECMPQAHIDVHRPHQFFSSKVMQMDSRAREALELTTSASSGLLKGQRSVKGSLLSVIRRTQTPSGARLLQDWLNMPLQDPKEIRDRQDKVQFFLDLSRSELVQIQKLLSGLPDGPRTLQKLGQSRIDPLDIVAFSRSVAIFNDLKVLFCELKSVPRDWISTMDKIDMKLVEFSRKIADAIDVNTLLASSSSEITSLSDETVMASSKETTDLESQATEIAPKSPRKKPSASSLTKFTPATNRDYNPVLNPKISQELQSIYDRESGYQDREKKIAQRVKHKYGPSAELRWSPSHQFYVYIVTNGTNEPEPSLLLGRSKKTAYIADVEWSKLGFERLNSSNDIREVEERIIDDLRATIITEFSHVMRNLYALGDEIDVQMSFAMLAMEKRLVRPEVLEDPNQFFIEKGRHITVEAGLVTGGFASMGFVSNDCDLSAPQPVCMITGPNMGGKSTYIRQNAIITILAHMGCFVPAKSAKLGVVDQIFCRIGAGDDLYNGRSTFMMEMLETSAILNCATNRSLAVLDEVGRGTSGKDGIAIAYASIKHLAIQKKCRTLFATHYGDEIWSIVNKNDAENSAATTIRPLQTGLSVVPGFSANGKTTKEIKFDYKLKPGIAASSCGLLIAELSGFPLSALEDAAEIVNRN